MAGGDFSVDFAAANPETYDHSTGGGTYGDGGTTTTVESLQAGDFECDDIVSYFAVVTVDQNPADANQTIELDFSFLADTTGQSGAAISDIVNVEVNPGDTGNIGDNDSTATLTNEGLTGDLFQSGSELEGTVTIDNLEAGEQVVVRIDVRLDCQAGSNPTGNLQGALTGGRVISPVQEGINTGEQTIPFQQFGNLDVPPLPDPILELEKTANVTEVDEAGDEIEYTYEITNTVEGSEATNITLVDDNFTSDTGDDFNPTFVSGDTDGDGNLDFGETWVYQASYTVTQADLDNGVDLVNVATADSAETEPITDDATVGVKPMPGVDLIKDVALTNDADSSQDISAGDELTYSFTLENTGNVTLTDVGVTDPLPGLSGIDFGTFDGTLDPGEEVTGTATYTVTAADVTAGTIENTATVAAEDPQGEDITDTDSEIVDLPEPKLEIDKMFVDFVDNDGNGIVTQGDDLNYTIKVSSTGDANLTDVTVSDPLTGLDETIEFLGAGDMKSFEVIYRVSETDALTGQVLNTGIADSTQTDPVQDTVDVPVKLAVDIDIKPGSFPSSFNLRGNGTVPVAIFGTSVFDATSITEVCLEEFMPGPSTGEGCTEDINFEDVNGDGITDAVAKFSKPDLIGVLDTDSEFAMLTGMTSNGVMFVGVGDVNVTQV
ncbi:MULTISPECIES: hypothetical protein [unclassified Moorena]|nr:MULTISPECIES: hypothetical protein [unclassified Moorena]NEP69255.1 DUF11 domain-containing protein [Moorena sp. SIO3A5]NER90292.1 DUF11 domain-containing protein [Moorena sp. SIO3A2]NES42386.1 DUF11 domain-containing protein [Moorena sp. SIO2C4]